MTLNEGQGHLNWYYAVEFSLKQNQFMDIQMQGDFIIITIFNEIAYVMLRSLKVNFAN